MSENEGKALRDLSDDQFMEDWTDAAKELDEAKEKCHAFRVEHDRRLAHEKIAAMPDAEREALAQFIRAEGIESLEAVGAENTEESDNG